ncbi:MAG TPA: hypothetical protein VJZ27_10775 [Aggregatilineales bacterium]|nr:hypothetical protein [Aggregatilineales bacterium]
MKALFRAGMFILILLLVLVLNTASGQTPIPIEVFARQDAAAQQLTLYFTNPISGLSSPLVISNFRRDLVAVQEMTVTPSGVLFQNPADGRILLATPDGRIEPHPFIPQHPDGLVDADPVLSPDGQSIAWVEVFPSAEAWISNIYMADANGSNLIQLPAPPPTSVAEFRRVMPLALTNDRGLFFYDAAAPVEAPQLTDYFVDYEDLWVYVAARGSYQHLPGEAGCPCGAGIGQNGRTLLRLEAANPGFDVRWWNLDSNQEVMLRRTGQAFAQAGNFFVSENDSIAFYTQAQNLEDETIDAQFALMMIDLTIPAQTMLIGPSAQRFKVMDVIDAGRTIILVDVYGGGTYKYDLSSDELVMVSDNSWLGTILLQ